MMFSTYRKRWLKQNKHIIPIMPPPDYTLHVIITIISVLALSLYVIARQYDKQINKARISVTRCHDCHRTSDHAKMTEYFQKAGSPVPTMMATAVLSTSQPRLMAAIAKVESNGNPNKRNSGYKKRHSGAWQVNPKHWGRVPHDPVKQALQADAILSELTATMPVKKALSAYGGDSSSRYQRTVLAELVNVP